jgi:hypothetical protein
VSAETLISSDSSTAGPDSPHVGPRKGLSFECQPEPCPDPHLQPGPQVTITEDDEDGSVGQ